VDACTVTALDAITAFAVPNPNCPSQSRRFFQVWLPFGLPATPALVGRLSVEDFELNLAMVPRGYGVEDNAERLNGVALPTYHAT